MTQGRFAVACLVATLAIAATPLRAQSPPPGATERVSADIRLENCAKVLRRVARVFDGGFGRGEADQLAREIDALPTDKAEQWTYEVQYAGTAATLTVSAMIDELSMVDLDFVTTPAIAARVRKALGDIER